MLYIVFYFFNREVELKGIKVEDIIRCRLPRENIEIKKPEVSHDVWSVKCKSSDLKPFRILQKWPSK